MIPEPNKQPAEEHPKGAAKSPGGGGARPAAPNAPPALPHQPGVGPGRVDVTGIIPEDILIDPNLTEGHPGYEESGDSEIIPPHRLAGGGDKGGKAD
jgi:hypothetical protein